MREHQVGVLLVLGLSTLAGCGRDFSLPNTGQDTTPPGFSGLQLSPGHATVGTTVTLEFDSSEGLPGEIQQGEAWIPNPLVEVAGSRFDCSATENHYQCTLAIELGMPEGSHEVSITALDGVGNQSVPVASPPTLVLDFTPPLLTLTANPPQVEPSQVLEIKVRSDEALAALPALSASFFPSEVCADSTGVGRLFVCTIILASTLSEADDLPHIIEARSGDLAGNQAQGQTTVIVSRPSPQLDPASVSVVPQVVTDGGAVNIGFRSIGGRLDRCGLLVGTRVATCLENHIDDGTEPPYTDCACTFEVVPEVLEGIQTATLIGTNPRGSAQLGTQFNVDRTAPWLDGSKLHFLRRAPGTEDAVWAEAGAVGDDLGLPYTDPDPAVVRVHLYDGPDSDAVLLFRMGPNPDGSLASAGAPMLLGDTDVTLLYAQAEDIAGNLGPRVPAGQVEATLTFEGRKPYDPAASPLSIHAFTTDLDPTALHPGFGAAQGESSSVGIDLVSFADGAELKTHAPIPARDFTTGIKPQYTLRATARVGDSRVVSFRHPVTGAFEMRGGQTGLCSGARSVEAQRFIDGGFEAAIPLARAMWLPSGDFDPDRNVEVWAEASGTVNECDGQICSEVTPVQRPTSASDARAAYHPGLQQLVRFGGMEAPGGVYTWFNETWAYDPSAAGGPTWYQLFPATRPGPRAAFSIASDAGSTDASGANVGPRLYVFGGSIFQWPAEQRYADLWAFDGVDWARLSTNGTPGARSHSVMVRDVLGNRLLVSGGLQHIGTDTNGNPLMRIDADVQAYDLGTGIWSTLRGNTVNGCAWDPDPAPCNFSSTGIWDPTTQRMLVFANGEVWAFNEDPTGADGSWENLTPTTAPEPRYLGALIDLPGAGRLALAGGFTETGLVSSGLSLWDGRWYDLPVDPLRSDLPPVTAVQIPEQPATMLFIDQTTWTISEVTEGAARIEAGTLALPAAGIRGATFDTARQEAIIIDGSIPPRTYAYDGRELRQLPVDSPPPFRDRYGLIYDAAHDEVLFFGGRTFNGTVTDELWAYDRRTWSLRQPTPSPLPTGSQWNCGGNPPPAPVPQARADAAFVYDARSGRALLLGGEGTSGELWSYDGEGWQLLVAPACSWSGGVDLPLGCNGNYSDYRNVVGDRIGSSAAYATAERATAFFAGRSSGTTLIDDEGFMLSARPRNDAGRTPAHLIRLHLEPGASLTGLVLHHRGQGLSPQTLTVPEPGLRLHVWVSTIDLVSGQPVGWIEISPTGAGDTNEVLDLDVAARLSDPLFTPAGIALADLVLGEQVWILITPRTGSQWLPGVGEDGHAELRTDHFWADATYGF